jgi:cytochrome o ubiquinol oxidase operon protein cyoD
MTESGEAPLAHEEVTSAHPAAFLAGYAVSMITMAMAFLVTVRHSMGYLHFLLTVSLLAVLALLAQAVFMFRLDLSTTQRWKTTTLFLVIPLFVLSVGLTGWMFHTLYPRTMLQFMQVQGSGM